MQQKMDDADILCILKNEINANENQAKDLLNGIHDAYGYYLQTQGMHTSNIPLTEYKNKLRTAQKSLNKLCEAIETLSNARFGYLDSCYYDVNNSTFLLDASLDELYTKQLEKSGFLIVAEAMRKTINHALENIEDCQRGTNRTQAKEYMSAIEMLGRYFSDSFPNTIKRHRQTTFFINMLCYGFKFI